MKVILFGASGMIGQGVLRECIENPAVETLLSVSRSPSGSSAAKLREVIHRDFTDFGPIAEVLKGYDVCFFCLGVSSAGMSEAEYRHITYDFTLAAGKTLSALNPDMTFLYISGAGTDSSEKGRSMWARVKGETENALLRLPFKSAYVIRPGFIQPLHGIRSRTRAYRAVYATMGPFYPALRRLFPKLVTNTEELGRAMLAIAKNGFPQRIIETSDLHVAAQSANTSADLARASSPL